MALKYTILKVTLQIFSKKYKFDRGFTLIELIVGMLIMLIVSGLAMNALVEANAGFSKDKRNIESNQNMSVILEMIGNDIKQAGENINDNNFPTIEFKIADATLDPTLKTGSSKIIVRRALLAPLTLCEDIAVNQSFSIGTNLIVAHNLKATVNTQEGRNCDVGTSSSPLSVYRVPTTVTNPAPPVTTPPTVTTITSYYPPSSVSNPYPVAPAPLALKLPLALRNVRDYRCNTDPNFVYDSAANAGADFCSSLPAAKLRIAVSNKKGQILIFNQTDEVAATTSDEVVNDDATNTTTSAKKYQITLGKSTQGIPYAPTDAVANNAKNIAVPITITPLPVSTIAYPIGSPIYAIEERVYTLTGVGDTVVGKGHLQVSINGAAPKTLVKKIDNFRVSARTYTNSTDRIIQPTPTADICTNAAPSPFPFPAPQPATADENTPKYICQFNYFTTTGTADWKTLAGIKVEIQTQYDGTGQNATATTADTNKLYAAAEFFPRNVLSK